MFVRLRVLGALGILVAIEGCSTDRTVSGSSCPVALVGGVPVYAKDVNSVRVEQMPPVEPARAEKILIEAAVVWLTDDAPTRPERIEVKQAMQSYRAFLKRHQVEHGGSSSGWVEAADKDLTTRRELLGVVKGPCTHAP